MRLEIEVPEKYGERLAEVEEVEPEIRDLIEIEVLPQVLRLINDAHRQIQEREDVVIADEVDEEG